MSKRRRSSTDRERRDVRYAPGTLDFDSVEGAGELLEQQWGVTGAALREVLTDPARVGDRLRELPALTILTCEILIEAGGVARSSSVARVLAERTGLGLELIERHLDTIEHGGLIAPVADVRESHDSLLVLFAPAAELVGERVWLASAPSAPPPSILLEEAPPADRSAMLAVAGLALHEPIKHTLDGGPHRGNVKKHARRLAMDEKLLWELVAEAVHAGALRPDARGAFVPDADRMARIATSGGATGGLDALVHAWLADGPRPREVLVRALARHRASGESHGFLHSSWYREPHERTLATVRDQLDRVPGLRRAQVDGVEWVGRAAVSPALPAQVEGFVTPNLEVMIGPEPDPRIVARLALAAELVRIDRVLTLRLRPKTVARAALAGIDGDAIVDVLGRVGRHGLPDAVRAQVLDWSAGARVALAQPMTALTFAPRIHDEVIAALGELVASTPARGIVLVAAGRSFELIRDRLSGLGIDVAGAAAQSALAHPREEHPLEVAAPPLPLDASRADEVLRRKIADERAAAFAPSIAEHEALEEVVPFAFVDWKAIRARAHGAPPDVRRAIEALAKLYESEGAELEAWLARQPAGMRECIDVVSAMFLVMLPAQHRKRLLSSDAPALEVVMKAKEILDRGWASPAGKKVLAALAMLDSHELYSFIRGLATPPSERPAPPPPRPMKRQEIVAGLTNLRGLEVPVRLSWETAEGQRSAQVWIDELRTRGKEPVVLVTEVESERSRVLPIEAVRSIELG